MDQWQHERAYAEWEERRAIERENAECDALIERLQRQRLVEKEASPDGVVRKVTMTPRHSEVCNQVANPQPPHGYMDDSTQKFWDDWATDIVGRHCEGLAGLIGEETGRIRRKQDDAIAQLEDRFAQLEEQIASLEARVAALEGNDNGDARRVLSLPKLQLRGSSGAA
jgi:hypothetical protein